jgi:hypothetical protein
VPLQLRIEAAYAAEALLLDVTLSEGQNYNPDSPEYRSWLGSAFSSERAARAKSLSAKRGMATAGLISMTAGILSAAAAGTLYYLGAEAGKTYDSAEDTASARKARDSVELYQALFPAAAAVGGGGLAAGSLFMLGGSDAKALSASIRALDEQIESLRK